LTFSTFRIKELLADGEVKAFKTLHLFITLSLYFTSSSTLGLKTMVLNFFKLVIKDLQDQRSADNWENKVIQNI
jgi:hypothetical protein